MNARDDRGSTDSSPRPGRRWGLGLGIVALILLATPAQADDLTLGFGSWSSAGGMATTGTHTLAAAVGQPVVGPATAEPTRFSAGILTGMIERVAIRQRPTAPRVPAGEELGVLAEIVSDDPADSVSLCYRLAGQREFETVAMVAAEDGAYTAAIPAADVGLRGIEYYLAAGQGDQTVHYPPWRYSEEPLQQAIEVSEVDAEGQIALVAGECRMISLPAMLSDGAADAVLGDDFAGAGATWNCGRWDPAAGDYCEMGSEELPAFAAGRAFWVTTDQARTIDFSGTSFFPTQREAHAIVLEPGWNQIGNPYAYDVALNEMWVAAGTETRTLAEAAAAGWLEYEPLHTFAAGQYGCESDVLPAWSGGFIANLAADPLDLYIPTHEAYVWREAETSMGPGANEADWCLNLRATCDEATATLELGLAAEAVAGWDAWDELIPPPALAPALMARSCNAELPSGVRTLRRDVRSWDDGGLVWDVEVLASESGGTLELHWQLAGSLPAGLRARMVDVERELFVDCDQEGGYAAEVSAGGSLALQFLVGAPDWIDDESEDAVPAGQHFDIGIIGGSIHREQTEIRLVLLQPETVTLQAYDVNGRLVRTVHRDRLSAGVHVLTWDGRNDRGAPAPTGVYFLRARGAGQEHVYRSLIVR